MTEDSHRWSQPLQPLGAYAAQLIWSSVLSAARIMSVISMKLMYRLHWYLCCDTGNKRYYYTGIENTWDKLVWLRAPKDYDLPISRP
ncbi:MAG: hypothetical protein ACLRMZ_08985 [Blautia marasmi]